MKFPSKDQVDKIKENFPVGTVIKLISMDDPYAPIPSGTVGEVTKVDDVGTLHMKWSNGSTLGIVPDEDDFQVLSRPQEENEMTMKGTI
ncbi:MAG: DUF4314 domain-containing protein [Clostridia bacterium]